ncbi:zinc finger C3H1 domain-containing protein-like isoform X2 [Apostichopus japonicus]|uniref:zinc finger C3H1 domain-containing protein-like isoform X2 n=1 Tax=Stichopus japonicus TaxID=307972 RepID=UPI003AB7F75E
MIETMVSRKNAVVPNQSEEKGETISLSPKTEVLDKVMPQEVPELPIGGSSPYPEKTFTYQPTRINRKPVIPSHGPLVITVNGDSDSSDEEPDADPFFEMKQYIKQARNSTKQPKETQKEDSIKEETKEKVIPKTPEALNKLPETHLAEYRRLKEEIARREQKKGKLNGKQSISKQKEIKKIADLEQKLNKNRTLMEKTYHVYQESARQQSEKQRNMQKALFKIQKLKEQIAVMEKVASLNKNLVNKHYEEQKRSASSLEICVSIEEKLREELSALKVTEVVDFPLLTTIQQLRDEQAAMTKRETQLASKDRINNYGVSKAGKTRANELHRLKKLEEQYALKIKRYKEAQAKASSQPSAASLNGDSRKRNSKETPRPAVSIYQKDKIQFSVNNTPTQTDSETEKENIDRENNGVGRTKRRRSWLDDNSSLTPQLSGKQKRLTQITNFTEKLNYSQDEKSLVEAGKVVDGKKKENVMIDRYSDRPLVGPQRGDYLHPSNYFTAELSLGKNKKHWIPMGRADDVEENFSNVTMGTYVSPLLCFRAYRLHRSYWKATGVSPTSRTFSNNVDPRRVLCKFELNGVCNDSSCKCQHERDYLLSEEAVLTDLLSYAPSLVNITPKMKPEEQSNKISRFLQILTEQVNKETSGCQSKDKQYFCLNSVTRQLRKDKVEVPILCERQWKPKKEGDKENRTESSHREEEEADVFQVLRSKKVPEAIQVMGVDDSRYYCGREKNIENLESLVLEESHDTELWLKLVSLILQEGSAECQDRALNALSRGLEHNPSSPDLWPVYLSLYSSRPEHPDLVEICTQAMQHTKDYTVYWKCLEVANTFQSKISSCQDILQLLTSDVSKKKEDRNSHRIFETVLYQTQVLFLTGRLEEACQFLQNVLTSNENEGIFLSFLTRPDVSLLWMAYIHLQSFRSLPTCLFEESGSGLGHVRKKTHFICPWHQPFSRSVDDVLTLFETASQSVKDDLFQSCSILYHNWVAVLTSSNRMQEAVDRCRQILEKYPVETSIWKTLLVLEMKRSQDIIKVREIYYEAFIKCPPSPELYYTAAKLENMEGFPAEAVSLLSDCAASFYDLPTEGASGEDTFNLFRILLNQPVPLSFKSPPMQQRLQPILETSQAYIWLCFCFLLTLKSSSPSAVGGGEGGEGDLGMEPKDAFELALSSRSRGEGLLDICLEYFQYQLRRPGPKPEERGKTLRQLVKNIITTRPSSFTYPFDEKHFYIDYSFHNTLLDVYLAYLQPKYITEAYEDYLSMMPKNLGLLQKFLDFLWVDEGYHYIKFLAKSTLATHPKCLFLWNALIRATEKTGNFKEVSSLCSEAARALPLVALLSRHHSQAVEQSGILENVVAAKPEAAR